MASKSYDLSTFWNDLSTGTAWDSSVVFNRTNPLPLDKFSVFPSFDAASDYAEHSAIAYPGQIVTVVNSETSAVTIYKVEVGGALTEIVDSGHQIEFHAGNGLSAGENGWVQARLGAGLKFNENGEIEADVEISGLIDPGDGLALSGNTLSVKTGDGIGIDYDTKGVTVKTGSGLQIVDGNVEVNVGEGLSVESGAVRLAPELDFDCGIAADEEETP